MNRKHTAKFHLADSRNDDFVPGDPAERIKLVWILTREIASLSNRYDVEGRLQRHVTRLIRRETGRTKDLADAEALESLKNSDEK